MLDTNNYPYRKILTSGTQAISIDYFISNGEVKVEITPSSGVQFEATAGTHYSITGAGDEDGGTVTMIGRTAGETVVISRDMSFTQDLDLPVKGKFNESNVEQTLDELTMNDQQLKGDVDRSIKLPSDETPTAARTTFPANPGTDKALGIDSLGNLVFLEPSTVAASDAASITYNQGGTGAVDTTVKAKLQESVSVKDYGAVGDGVTDDTSAIQAALDDNKNGSVFIPAGIYKITSTLVIGTAGTLEGPDPDSWRIRLHGSGVGSILWVATDGIVGLWVKRNTNTDGTSFSWPSETTRLEHFNMVGPDAVDGSGNFVGLSSAPTDTVTLLKSGAHTEDGDAANYDSGISMDGVGLWCANYAYKSYLTHYGSVSNLSMQRVNFGFYSNGSIAMKVNVASISKFYGPAFRLKACDAFHLDTPIMQNYTGSGNIIDITGATRGMVITAPYWESFDSGTLLDCYTDGAGAFGPKIVINGGAIIGGTSANKMKFRGTKGTINGLFDTAANKVIELDTEIGIDADVVVDEQTNLAITPLDNNQRFTKLRTEKGWCESNDGLKQHSNFTTGHTTIISTSRRGSGLFTVSRRTSATASQREVVPVNISETGDIQFTSSVVTGLSFTDDGGFLKISVSSAASAFTCDWVYYD